MHHKKNDPFVTTPCSVCGLPGLVVDHWKERECSGVWTQASGSFGRWARQLSEGERIMAITRELSQNATMKG